MRPPSTLPRGSAIVILSMVCAVAQLDRRAGFGGPALAVLQRDEAALARRHRVAAGRQLLDLESALRVGGGDAAFARVRRRHAHLRAPDRRAVVGGDDLPRIIAVPLGASARCGCARRPLPAPAGPAGAGAPARPPRRRAHTTTATSSCTRRAKHRRPDRSTLDSHGTSVDSLMSTAFVSPSLSENDLASSRARVRNSGSPPCPCSRFCTAMIR